MSPENLINVITREARTVFKNPRIRNEDIEWWSPGQPSELPGEALAFLPIINVWVIINKKKDGRGTK